VWSFPTGLASRTETIFVKNRFASTRPVDRHRRTKNLLETIDRSIDIDRLCANIFEVTWVSIFLPLGVASS
jgi:hypothetical protein